MKRALISVTNKDGVVDFAKGLVELGFEIVSTGGTMKVLQENGVSCIAIDDVTGFPEMLDGRVKTLHPMVHGGLLYRRDLPSHVETIKKHGIHPIDLVCVNLYEFEKALKAGKDLPDMIENIDIGGPSMIRSAAKNFKDVLIVTDPKDYDNVLDAIKNDTTDFDFRMNLAYKAFSMTGAYDAMISRYFADQVGDQFPDTLNLSLKKVEHLRYGENSQQAANKYEDSYVQKSLLDYEQLHGKEISFNNVNDLYGAVALVREFGNQIVTAAIKHSTPCGVAIGNTGYDSYMKAYEADPQSIFGGIVAVNYKIDKATAEQMHKIFLEIVAAPDFDDDALEILKKKKKGNYVVIQMDEAYVPEEIETKDVFGITFEQGRNNLKITEELFEDIPTVNKALSEEAKRDLIVALITLKYTQSNSVCYVKDGQAIGIGAGQQSRVHCTRLAGNKADNWYLRQNEKVLNLPFKEGIRRADRDNAIDVYISDDYEDVLADGVWENTFTTKPEPFTREEKKAWLSTMKDVALGSDAFFPFGDNIERAHKSGVTYIAQAGGSIRDDNVIETCDKYDIVMAFTHARLFHH